MRLGLALGLALALTLPPGGELPRGSMRRQRAADRHATHQLVAAQARRGAAVRHVCTHVARRPNPNNPNPNPNPNPNSNPTQVTTPEAAEVLAINTLAPFIINSRLRRLPRPLQRRPQSLSNPDPNPDPDANPDPNTNPYPDPNPGPNPNPNPGQAARGLSRAAALRGQRERDGGQVLPLQDAQPPAHQHGQGRAPHDPTLTPTRTLTLTPTPTRTWPRPRSRLKPTAPHLQPNAAHLQPHVAARQAALKHLLCSLVITPGGAQHDDAHLRARAACELGHPDELGRHGLDQRREPTREGRRHRRAQSLPGQDR